MKTNTKPPRKIVQFLYDTSIEAPCEITGYMHCIRCLEEWKTGIDPDSGQPIRMVMSPADYSRTQIGITPTGLQVWCGRHHMNVTRIKAELKEEA